VQFAINRQNIIFRASKTTKLNQNTRIVEENKSNGREEIYSEKVKAGKRTYFFDVKSTRSNDYYLTITESKKRFKDDGFTYEKHKIFLYKEDFTKFVAALNNAVSRIKGLMPGVDFDHFERENDHEEVTATSGNQSSADTELKWE
jgi:hypothetical protein